mmetsp:Transcript_1535/g.4352  ORF Transcript_1535/g.4352 Transcript_1535/m.4352 type:complete len:86 (-) Transcript_1535:145-402(-)
MCDPVRSFVTKETAKQLLGIASATRWKEVLEKVCGLLRERGTAVLPSIDHGRIHHFLRFWTALDDKPEWMGAVLRQLALSRWPAY